MPKKRRGKKPNPLAGFERVGCGVFMVGKAPTATGLAIYLALAQSANSKKEWARKSVWLGRGRTGIVVGWFGLRKKKKTDFAGKSVFF